MGDTETSMGDTFQDHWQDQVPEEWKSWKFDRCDNTKWEGNFYRFIRKGDERREDGSAIDGRRMEVFFHSGVPGDLHTRRDPTPRPIELTGGYYFSDEATGLTVDCKKDWDWSKGPAPEPWKWTSIDEAMKALTDGFEEMLKSIEPAITHLRAAHMRWKG